MDKLYPLMSEIVHRESKALRERDEHRVAVGDLDDRRSPRRLEWRRVVVLARIRMELVHIDISV